MENLEVQNALASQLMSIGHRDYNLVVPAMRSVLNSDPFIGARGCVYIYHTTKIRDQQDAAIITLLTAPPEFQEYRAAGRAMLASEAYVTRYMNGIESLDPFRKFRIWEYIVNESHYPSRLMRNTMSDYFNFLARSPERFDDVFIRNRKMVTDICSYYRIYPKPIRDYLNGDYPTGSKAYWIRQIHKMDDLVQKARLGVEKDIPYTVLSSLLLPKKDPAVGAALILSMTPQQAANSISWVEKSGYLGDKELADFFWEQVGKAKSIASLDNRKSSRATSERGKIAVTEAKNRQSLKKSDVTLRTLVLIDVSSSMQEAIDVAVKWLVHMGAALDPELTMLVAFREYGIVLPAREFSFESLTHATRELKASGGTSMAAGLDLALRDGFKPQQVAIITDGQEGGHSYLEVGKYSKILEGYAKSSGTSPRTVIIGVGHYSTSFAASIRERGLPAHSLPFTEGNEYYIYDQAGAILSGEPDKTLAEVISQVRLPEIVKKR